MKNTILKPIQTFLFAVSILAVVGGALSTSSAYAAWGNKKEQAKVTSDANVSAKVNVNKADAKTLSSALIGVGLSKANAIVTYRENNGKFSTLADLTKVKGIGDSTVAKNKARIVF